jgi:hypothetical protein
MKATIRLADLEADRGPLISVFREHLDPQFDERRFDWMYFQGPHGRARVWVSEDEASKRIVGAAAAFPRQMYFRGAKIRSYVLGDFCIHPTFRTLGPALQLQRACLDGISAESGTVWYDFPSEAMTAVYRRLGIAPQTQHVRLTKVLRADRILARKLKSGPAQRFIGRVANSALRARESLRRRGRAVQVTRHQGTCGDEFSQLAQQARKPDEICVANSAEYLNWRFLFHPFQQFDILTARSENTLVGYVILARHRDDARIVSLRSLDDEQIATDLILAALDSMHAVGVVNVNASLLTSDPRVPIFVKLGFRPRESRPVALSKFSFPDSAGKQTTLTDWHLMDGDRDS